MLQEFYVVMLRKLAGREESTFLPVLVDRYAAWPLVPNTYPLLRAGIRLQQRYQLSFGDALILAAAIEGRAEVLFSEDFSAGAEYEGVRIVNPLAS